MNFNIHYLICLCFLFEKLNGKQLTRAVAFTCGKPSLHLTYQGWVQDDKQDCLHAEADIISYCQHIYVDQAIINTTFTPVIEIDLDNWCRFGQQNCTGSKNEHSHQIQPWICLQAHEQQLTIPVGCSVTKLGGYNEISCRKQSYWDQLASGYCKKPHQISYTKPCLKDGSYSHAHFLGIELVCCGEENIRMHKNRAFAINQDRIIIEKDTRVYQHYLRDKLPITNRSTEHKLYNDAKKSLNDEFIRREAILEDQLADAELRLDKSDWTKDPQRNLEKENQIVNDFRRKFIADEEQRGQLNLKLNKVHRGRVLQGLEQHYNSALASWDNAVGKMPYNVTNLLRAADDLLYTVERLRTYLLKRIQHTPQTAVPADLVEWNRRLEELNAILNESLSKLDKKPHLRSAILQHMKQWRAKHYPRANQLNDSDALAHPPVISTTNAALGEPLTLIDKAERIIAKHVHNSNRHQDEVPPLLSRFEAPHIINVLEVSASTPKPPPIVNENPPPSSSTERIKELVVSVTFPSSQKKPAVTLKPTSSSSSAHSGVFWIFSISFALNFIGLVAFVVRRRQRNMRLRRAGYLNTTVMEVDEVVDGGNSGRLANRSRNTPANAFSRWRFNGYENPAYTTHLLR